jgi:hypothetical protein
MATETRRGYKGAGRREGDMNQDFDIPINIRIAFDELRAVRAKTASTVLTLSAYRNLNRAVKAAGFTSDEGVHLAVRAVRLGNLDAGRRSAK